MLSKTFSLISKSNKLYLSLNFFLSIILSIIETIGLSIPILLVTLSKDINSIKIFLKNKDLNFINNFLESTEIQN